MEAVVERQEHREHLGSADDGDYAVSGAERRQGVFECRALRIPEQRVRIVRFGGECGDAAPAVLDLDDRMLLFVGGRPKLIDQLRGLTSRAGGVLLSHDGGIEDNPSLLPGLVSRCDVALFSVDCISHSGALAVKRLCHHAGKPFVALRSASVASFVAALASLRRPADGASERVFSVSSS